MAKPSGNRAPRTRAPKAPKAPPPPPPPSDDFDDDPPLPPPIRLAPDPGPAPKPAASAPHLGLFDAPVNNPPAAQPPAPPPGDPAADARAEAQRKPEAKAEPATEPKPQPVPEAGPSASAGEPEGEPKKSRAEANRRDFKKRARGWAKLLDRGDRDITEAICEGKMDAERLKRILEKRKLDDEEVEALAGPVEDLMSQYSELLDPWYLLAAQLGVTFGPRMVHTGRLVVELYFSDDDDEEERPSKPAVATRIR